jgi:hypothetical protein
MHKFCALNILSLSHAKSTLLLKYITWDSRLLFSVQLLQTTEMNIKLNMLKELHITHPQYSADKNRLMCGRKFGTPPPKREQRQGILNARECGNIIITRFRFGIC